MTTTHSSAGPAKKSLGQHFLKDASIIARIVELMRLNPGEQVLEIGPGPGALTTHLYAKALGSLMLVEKDDHWAAHHANVAQKLLSAPKATQPAHMEVIHGDALAFSWASLAGTWKIVGNLPYNIASPLMWDIVSQAPEWNRAVFMIQKEVADRILAGPGSKTYGALTVWLRSYADISKGITVGPHAFSPPPKVDSAVIVLQPHGRRPKQPQKLAQLIKICFQQRRKQLNGILQKALPEIYTPGILENMGIALAARPETLSELEFERLTNALWN